MICKTDSLEKGLLAVVNLYRDVRPKKEFATRIASAPQRVGRAALSCRGMSGLREMA
jgi:hypothetical protein